MIPSDADKPQGAGVPPMLPSTPEPVPPPLPVVSRQKKTSSLLIVALAVGAFVLIMAVAMGSMALFFHNKKVGRQASLRPTQQPRRDASTASRAKLAPVTLDVDAPGAKAGQPRPIKSEPGVSYMNDKMRDVPWSIHVVKVDRSQKDLGFFSTHAQGRVLGVSMLADQASAIPREFGRAVAGVNGDFYERDNRIYAGDPRGLQIVNNDLISGPHTVCVWFDGEGTPHLDDVKADFAVTWPGGARTAFGLNQRRASDMAVLYTPTYGPATRSPGGRELVLEKEGAGPWLPLGAGQTYRAKVRDVNTEGNTQLAPGTMVLSVGPELLGSLPDTAVAGAVVEISTKTTPDLKGVGMAIAGGPSLVKDGVAFAQKSPPAGTSGNWSERSKYERHPRSAIGWNATHVFLVTVDGRQPSLSAGMKLAELAEYMAGLGCTDAMNLDGGKSAQMWLSGRIVNSPCQGEDTVANSLMVVRKVAAGAN